MLSKMDQHNRQALPWIGLWLLAFTGAMTSIKFIETATVYQVAGLRFFLGTFFVILLLYKKGINPLHTKRLSLQTLNALCRTLSVYATYYAYGALFLTLAAAIGYTRPLMAMGLAILLLRERPHWQRWLAVALGYLGVYLILDPQVNDTFNWGIAAAFTANGLASISQICSKRLTKTEAPLTIMFYENALPLLFSLGIGFYFWETPTDLDYILVLIVACLGTVSQFSALRSLRIAEVSFIAPFEYMRLLLVTPIGFFFLGETLTPGKFVGCILILLASWFVTRPNKKI